MSQRFLGPSAMFAVTLLGATGCFVTPVDTEDNDGGTTNPNAGQACPSGEPHLVVGLTPLQYDGYSQIVRRTSSLRSCRGVTFSREDGDLNTLTGTSSGRDLLGFDSGRLMLYEDRDPVWERTRDDYDVGYGVEVGSVFTMWSGGQEIAGVIWVDSYGYAEELMLIELGSGGELGRYSVSSSLNRASSSIDPRDEGRFAGITGTSGGDGVQEFRAQSGADTLGTTGERQITSPGVGSLNWVSSAPDLLLAASGQGVLYWPHDNPTAFLGPVACRWPGVVGGDALDPEYSGETYYSVAHDLNRDNLFIAAVEGQLLSASESSSFVVRMSYRGECEILIRADEDHRIMAVAWSGL